ncbi:MAG: LacI family transcriptional regulator [Anaerolineae bacterium]|jgi:LacI family transcriptional regulator|nr:LacI family transcriptional regulator [Anaerolineae bacterium]
MAKAATLADVAKKSRVSISTVSLVLRNKGNIPQDTRQRVLDAAREVGYRVKMAPARLAENAAPLRTIGVVAKANEGDSPLANPFYSQVISGIEEACRQRNINMLLAILPTDKNNYPIEIPRLLAEDHADGLLLIGALVDRPLELMLDQKEAAVVLVDAYAPYREYDAVVSDNYHGMYQAVSHLIAWGHREIALIGTGNSSFPSVVERRDGYLQAIRDFSLEPHCLDCWYERAAVARTLEAHLADFPNVTAIVGINDETALESIRALQSMGRRVPEDVSVVGFDDIALSGMSNPALTTMQVDKRGMGQNALELLMWRLRNPTLAPMTLMMRARLVERESVHDRREK